MGNMKNDRGGKRRIGLFAKVVVFTLYTQSGRE